MLSHLSQAVNDVYVTPEIRSYVLDVVDATRAHPDLLFGASPRAGLALLRTSCAYAVTAGRNYLKPDDVKAVAEVVLAHRLAVSAAADLGGRSASTLIAEILASVTVPVRVPSGAPVAAG